MEVLEPAGALMWQTTTVCSDNHCQVLWESESSVLKMTSLSLISYGPEEEVKENQIMTGKYSHGNIWSLKILNPNSV